ncbi:MAG: terminase large subunit domain-containing protein [Methanosarcinales archaeon]
MKDHLSLTRRHLAEKLAHTCMHMMLLVRYRHDIVYFAERELLRHKGWSLSEDQRRFLEWASNISNRRAIVSGGRGSGKTLVGAILAVWSATVLPYFIGREYHTLIMGGSFNQSRKMYEYCLDFYRYSKFVSQQLESEPLRAYTKFKRGSIRAIACSAKQSKSPHVDQLILDEVTEAKNQIVTLALSVTDESPFPRRIALSTPDVPSSIFLEWWLDAESWGYSKFNFDAEKCPWKDPQEIKLAKRKLAGHEYQTLYKGLPVAMESMIIPIEQIRAAQVPKRPYADKNTEVYAGLDWGLGGPHKTVLTVIKIKDGIHEVVLSEEIPGTASVKHEAIIKILSRYRLLKLCADNSHMGENQRLIEAGLPVEQVAMGTVKDSLIAKMQRLFEQGKIKIWDENLMLTKQLTSYHWIRKPSGKYTPEKGDDDYVDSLLYALLACGSYVPDAYQYLKVGKFGGEED